jgi:hypothetical protein
VQQLILHKANNPELTYTGGQQPIVHLEADLNTVMNWANANGVRWAFSDGNAGAYITAFYSDPADLVHLDWSAINSTDFRDAKVKEGKQAEFLMFDVFPWTLIEKIGTINNTIATKVQTALVGVGHQPVISVEASWYF